MNKTRRISLFLLSLVLLSVVYAVTKTSLATLGVPWVVILSSLIMLSFITLFLEHFFTTPTDVLASAIAILLLLAPLRSELHLMGRWYDRFFAYNVLLFLASLVALLLLDASKSAGCWQNRLSADLKRFSVFFGKGRLLFFALFILMLLFYVDTQSKEFLILFGYAALVVIVDPKSYVSGVIRGRRRSGDDIGEIFGVQSKNMFLVKLFRERRSVKRYDLVEFRYSMDDNQRVMKGLIVDNYLLNAEQWVKVLATKQIRQALEDFGSQSVKQANVVYKIESGDEPAIVQRLVGLVVDGATIEKLRFEYLYRVPISDGDLLEVDLRTGVVLYQVVQGITDSEMLESKNKAGYVIGEAVQLGMWNAERKTFDKYGWVPDVNTPVFTASQIDPPELSAEEVQIGVIPKTNYPVAIDLSDAVTHHLAILGVTGSGKSVFARDLIRKIIAKGKKVICVDFTEEYKPKFSDQGIDSVISVAHQESLFAAIDTLATELAKFANQQNPAVIAAQEKVLHDLFFEDLKAFLKSEDRKITVFELPDVANTTGILDYTKWFFRVLFDIAKKEKNFGQKICVVLEEAHTVIPEWNFIGVSEKQAQSLVNNIGQIALQGRKYGVGFVIIAQRTANVSKTVLTQCNSVVAFQQFDKTSSDFLANYMGQDMVNVLPTLRFRQAIGVGKAFKTGIPLILEVPLIAEPEPVAVVNDEENPF